MHMQGRRIFSKFVVCFIELRGLHCVYTYNMQHASIILKNLLLYTLNVFFHGKYVQVCHIIAVFDLGLTVANTILILKIKIF